MARVTGLEALKARIDRIPADSRAAIQAELQRSAADVVALQKTLAPVDEGDLSSSIKTEPGRHELAVNIVAGGPEAPHAVHVETGTSSMDAQPFFFPGWRAMRKTIKRRLARAAGKAARKEAGL
jgi:HK97 gp10 family phage protein